MVREVSQGLLEGRAGEYGNPDEDIEARELRCLHINRMNLRLWDFLHSRHETCKG